MLLTRIQVLAVAHGRFVYRIHTRVIRYRAFHRRCRKRDGRLVGHIPGLTQESAETPRLSQIVAHFHAHPRNHLNRSTQSLYKSTSNPICFSYASAWSSVDSSSTAPDGWASSRRDSCPPIESAISSPEHLSRSSIKRNAIQYSVTWRDLGHLPSMSCLKIHRAEVTQCRMEPFFVVDLFQEPQ